MMDEYELDKRIQAANRLMIGDEVEEAPTSQQPQESVPQFVDVYQQGVDKMRKEQKTPRPKGAPSVVKHVVEGVIAERLGPAYNKARDDSDLLEKQGEKDRARLVRSQYMQEQFLPAVESVIMLSSPDELLNATKALSVLDEYVLNETGGSGYTASYVRTAYKDSMGNSRDLSDPTVKRAVMRIKDLADCGNNRLCYGLAKQIKKQIDDGEHIASDVDYELISRVSAYFR